MSIADSVRTAQDKDGMLRRALERIIQLYTDKSHFIYELLQNAEDAEATSIKFIQYPDGLEVFHDGRPFTSSNLQGLCDIGKSDKVDNLNQIGEFGVGFKSVFGICDTVRIYSAPKHFREHIDDDVVPFAVKILDFTCPEDIPEESLPKAYTTRFVFPFAVGHAFSGFQTIQSLIDTLARKLQNLGITTLLFMKHLEIIEYEIKTAGEPITGAYLLDKKEINDHCMKISAYGVSEKEKADSNAADMISYLKFSRKLEKHPSRTVDIAFPVKEENGTYHCIKAPNPFVSVYFPTETESKLDFIVQGPYRTTPNRSSIPAEDDDNIMLAQETAKLLRQSILELKDAGKLNLSFVKALPIDEQRFETFGLFLPLYETVKELFRTTAIIPSNAGKYVHARYARITRSEQLAGVLTDSLLTQLINDGHDYFWLWTKLTETNQEYKHVREFLTRELEVKVFQADQLCPLIKANPNFLPGQPDDWLVELYCFFERNPNAFAKTTADIVKTATGAFAAPFRLEGESYIPNVFLPSPKIDSADIHFVDQAIYNRCRAFFDNTLRLQKPNEYEFLIKDIEKRYASGCISDDDRHIDDIKALLKYVKNEDYSDEVSRIIKETLVLRCSDGVARRTSDVRIFLPISQDGINIEAYYSNMGRNVFFIDLDYYRLHGIDASKLVELGVHDSDSILVGKGTTEGTYDTGLQGRQPNWYTLGEFRWHLSADALKEVLGYISKHPTANDAILKSQAIMKMLVNNEARLCGCVIIGGKTQNKENEPCEMIHILRGERAVRDWDGKWIFTESGELVAPKAISKHDISTAIYGRIKSDSIIFKLLEFKRTDADEFDDLKKLVSQEKLDAFFEMELRQRYGISSADLNERYGESGGAEAPIENERLPFPSLNVKSWEALRKHAMEMLVYADPTRYEERLRRIRTSNHPRETKAYLQNMYRYEGNNKFNFACQLCHETCSSFEATEVFLRPETELDSINLCLCPNCAAAYRRLRVNDEITGKIRKTFLTKSDNDIVSGDYVVVPLDGDNELWFTQTHFAEIRELMRLMEEAKSAKGNPLA